MRSVRDIPVLHDIPVLVRAALNVPIAGGRVVNDFRLEQALPTINFLRAAGAKVILAGHLGDKGVESFAPVFEALKPTLPGLAFSPVAIGKEARAAVRALHPGEVLLLENLRRYPGETKNDPAFAKELALLADIFVQDSFDVCHRMHASVVGVPEFLPSYAGLLVEAEVRELTKALTPAHPSLAIIGGAKFATKEPVLKKLLTSYDQVFVGGALANDFLRALGNPVGKSLVSDAPKSELTALLQSKKILLPLDAVVAGVGESSAQGRVVLVEEVGEDEVIYDSGPRTAELLSAYTAKAKTILWNGPLGNYERGFTAGTDDLARALAHSAAYAIVGGGDTIAAIEHLALARHFSFLSTGGGAMLDFLARGTLPGVAALNHSLTK